ncbi:MAG TPA: septum formation initiator family protein [Tissierellales bacterium]|nr:septum formation initiator family protein [Tissierellales bacterium]
MNKVIVAKKEVKDYREYYNEEKQLTNNKVLKDKKNRKKEINKKKSKEKLRFLKTIGLMFLVCVFILNRYTKITGLSYEVSNLETEVEELNREKEDLKTELDGLKAVAKIEKDAKLKLGMNYPTEDQIVNVDVKDDIFENKVAENKEFDVAKYLKNVVDKVLKFF